MNNHDLSVAVWLFNRNLLCAEPVLKSDITWIQLKTQQRRGTKCTPVNRMAYTSCPVSHCCTKCICIYITWYEGLDKSQGHGVYLYDLDLTYPHPAASSPKPCAHTTRGR